MTIEILENSKIIISKHQVFGEIGEGEIAILNLKDSVYYGMNDVAGRIWSLIQEPKTMGEIRDILLEEYEIDLETCTRELVALLQDLASRGMIEVNNGQAV